MITVSRVLHSQRALTYLLALVIAIFVGSELAAVTAPDPRNAEPEALPPDRAFVTFYAAGRIVLAGDGDRLYDSIRQQEEFFRVKGYEHFPLPFTYPAPFALLLAPLSALPYSVALGGWIVMMLAAIVGSVLLLRRVSPTVQRYQLIVGLGLLAYVPLLWSIFDGLSVALMLLCCAGMVQALQRRRSREAGVWLGVLFMKPQLALPIAGLLLWRRQWSTVATASATGLALSVVAMAGVAPGWPFAFARLLFDERYHQNERACCGMFHASIPSLVAFTFPGQWLAWAFAILSGFLAIGLTLASWRKGAPGCASFPLQFGLGLAVAIAWSPHALFYETSLLALPVLALLDAWGVGQPAHHGSRMTGRKKILLAAMFVAGLTWPLVRIIHVQPMTIVPPLVAVACWRELRCMSAGTPRAGRDMPSGLPAQCRVAGIEVATVPELS